MNINLSEEQKKNIENKFLEFQKKWTLERVKDMTLEEYIKIGSKDTFAYCIEYFLKDIGSIRGGSNSKFGICKRNFNDNKENLKGKIYNDNYAWLSKYGDNQDEAFNKIKQIIINIIQASKNNDLETIENIDFGDATKWKIAFHYQDIQNIKIINIFSKNILKLISLNEFKKELKIYQIHEKLLKNEKLSLIEMMENLAIPLWDRYGVNNKDSDYFEDNILYEENKYNKKNNFYLNQILYGPPGTGKTYHTIDKALEILGENLENRDDKKAKFDEYVKNGQIVFTTFHQSYGYEEFVEGIKPIIDNDENSQEVKYDIKDGIFKKLCKKALDKKRKITNNEDISIDKNSKVWKISLGANASLRDECFEKNKICIGWNDIPKNKDERFLNLGSNDKNSIISFVEYMQIGDLVCVFNTSKTIKGVGVIVSNVKYSDGEYQTYREVKWISKNDEINILDLNNDKILVQKTVYELYRINSNDLLAKINLNNPKDNTNNLEIAEDNTTKNFIIIIDEINRGNVSKIFGELITLIEPSKRIGEEEELRVRLPYSGEEFGVPKNVYIIGTMNTADRSITSLDTALRRRFEFVEMMPDVSKLSTDCEGVNLQELLQAINTRIEYLLDREKTIGHAFFIGIDNLEKLKNVFQNKIIPLLQEYFYNDYALIDAVLNKNGMLEKQDINNNYLKNMTELTENDKIIYKFSDSQKWDETTFKKIYE